MKNFNVVTDTLQEFIVKIVKNGDSYGKDNCLINTDETMIEFYKNDYFVSRYYISTFNDIVRGLDLGQGYSLDYLTVKFIQLELSDNNIK